MTTFAKKHMAQQGTRRSQMLRAMENKAACPQQCLVSVDNYFESQLRQRQAAHKFINHHQARTPRGLIVSGAHSHAPQELPYGFWKAHEATPPLPANTPICPSTMRSPYRTGQGLTGPSMRKPKQTNTCLTAAIARCEINSC